MKRDMVTRDAMMRDMILRDVVGRIGEQFTPHSAGAFKFKERRLSSSARGRSRTRWFSNGLVPMMNDDWRKLLTDGAVAVL